MIYKVDAEVVMLKQQIIDDLLNVSCPKCAQKFTDFKNCFALTCRNKACRVAFCAWCFKDCGDDAHQHVIACPDGDGQVYGDREKLKLVWNKIVQNMVLESIAPELRDLKMVVTMD